MISHSPPRCLKPSRWLVLLLAICTRLTSAQEAPASPILSAAAYPSLQAAVDANPGRSLYLPTGEYHLAAKLRLSREGTGLWGPGHIIQDNPAAPIIELEHGTRLSLRDLTLSRPVRPEPITAEGILIMDCREVLLQNVTVLNHRSPAAALSVRESHGVRVEGCTVRNYMAIAVDDRTASPNYGYAFKCIDGTGLAIVRCTEVCLRGNRIVEEELLPTPEVQKQHGLGAFTKKNPAKGLLIAQATWDAGYVNNWHQGSAIIVTGPEHTTGVQILNNQVENAAQGVDIHADHVLLQGNVIRNAFIGMKAMHGSRHVIILANQFIRNDLWSIGLMPGAAAHPAKPAQDGQPAIPPNVDGGSIIANNIVSEFGQGHAAWIWAGQGTPFRFDTGQEPDDPPLRDVIVQGNLIYNSRRDEATAPEPLYEYAVRLPATLEGAHFQGNLFHPGRHGISNQPLPP